MPTTWPTPNTSDMWWTQFHDIYGRASTLEAAFQGYLAKHGLAPNPSIDQLQTAFADFQVFMEMSAETDASNPVEEPIEPPSSARLQVLPSLPPGNPHVLREHVHQLGPQGERADEEETQRARRGQTFHPALPEGTPPRAEGTVSDPDAPTGQPTPTIPHSPTPPHADDPRVPHDPSRALDDPREPGAADTVAHGQQTAGAPGLMPTEDKDKDKPPSPGAPSSSEPVQEPYGRTVRRPRGD